MAEIYLEATIRGVTVNSKQQLIFTLAPRVFIIRGGVQYTFVGTTAEFLNGAKNLVLDQGQLGQGQPEVYLYRVVENLRVGVDKLLQNIVMGGIGKTYRIAITTGPDPIIKAIETIDD